MYLSAFAGLAPLVAAAVARRPVSRGRAWVLAWSALLLVESGVDAWLALHHVRNLWTNYLFSPVANVMVLWALSCWQVKDVARLTMRLTIVPLLGGWLLLTLAFESITSFSRAADPLVYLIALSAAAYTLIARSRTATVDLMRQDWLWVSAGLALYLGTYSMLSPLSALLVGSNPVLLLRAYELQAVLVLAAFASIARGMTLPLPSAKRAGA